MREQTRTKQPTSWMQVDFGLNPGTANHIVMLGFMTVSSFSVAGNSRLFKYVHCKSKCSPKQCLHNATPVPLLRVQKHTDTESRKCRDQERADQNWNSRTLTHQCTLSLSLSLSLKHTLCLLLKTQDTTYHEMYKMSNFYHFIIFCSILHFEHISHTFPMATGFFPVTWSITRLRIPEFYGTASAVQNPATIHLILLPHQCL